MRALDQPLYATDPVVWNRLPGWNIGLSTASPGTIDNAKSCHGQLLPGGPQSSKVLGGGSFLHARSQTEGRVSDSSRAAHCASCRRPLSATYLFGASTLMIFGTMKVLVVGATGYLGSRIAVESARRGHKVTALVSEGSQSKKADIVQRLRDAGIEIATGHLESKQELLVKLLTDVNIVSVFCSSCPSENALYILEWALSLNS